MIPSSTITSSARTMHTLSTVDESFARLHRAGWSVGDVRLLTAEGPAWLVSGTNGGNEVRARGTAQGFRAGHPGWSA